MKFIDLLLMSLGNLSRRKMRTVLTILGVLIGTTSVVTMISLGIGLNELTFESIDKSVSLKSIEVYPMSIYGMDGAQQSKDVYIKDETINKLKGLEHVESVSPMLELDGVTLKQGVYEASVTITGVSDEYLENMKLAFGTKPSHNDKELKLAVGKSLTERFYNVKTKKAFAYTNDIKDLADIDYKKGTFFIVYPNPEQTTPKGNSSSNSDAPTSEGTAEAPVKKYIANISGVEAGEGEQVGDYESNTMYSSGVYANVDVLISTLRRIYGKNPIPGQPVYKNGKPYSYIIYNKAIVNVDSIDNVVKVQKLIKEMGFEAMAEMEWLQQSQNQTKTMQATLGGIGAVSLFVAAIGIANTMMMSIYERTKEIGIMKVLGCDMNRIRDMFLIESGFIGLFGGVSGVVLSYIVAFIINKLGVAEVFFYMTGDLARIPLWLAAVAIVFAVIVGMLAGALPARRAMSLSPLAALRNE